MPCPQKHDLTICNYYRISVFDAVWHTSYIVRKGGESLIRLREDGGQKEKMLPKNRFAAPTVRCLFMLSMILLIVPTPILEDKNPPRLLVTQTANPQPGITKSVKKTHSPVRQKAMSCTRFRKVELSSHPIIVDAANRCRVDPALVKAIIMAESGYNPRAVSSKGAKGLMQLMPATAQWLGVEDVFDPEHNINGGVEYFGMLLNQFDGDVRLALAAYNAGSRKVRHYRGIPPFKATRLYIKKVFEYYEFYGDQAGEEVGPV